VSKNKPAKAMTNFLEIEENKTLLIGSEMFIVYFFARERKFIKVSFIKSELQSYLHVKYHVEN
jgi:hypothetical protein